MARPESIQWQHRRWLGDQRVLGMDWDAKAMHFHLLMMSIQEEPPGSIPDDMALIRRWLGSPSEDIWRRVRPQVLSAWTLRTDRWFNQGMVETFERKERFSKRYENSTKKGRESAEKQENSNSIKELDFDVGSKKFLKPSLEEVTEYVHARGDLISADAFYDYYESVGWKVGNKPMKKWKNAVGTWERRISGQGNGKPTYETAQERRSRNNDAAIIAAMRSRVIARTEGNGEDAGHGSGPPGSGGMDAGVRERQPGSGQMVLSPMAQRERNAPNPGRNTKVGA